MTNTTTNDPISSWLDLFCPSLHFSELESRSIRDELESHLQDRMRDLMLEGNSESESVYKAIHELGEMDLLARRYLQAEKRSRFRRITMNILTFGMAGAVVVGASTITTVGINELRQNEKISVFQDTRVTSNSTAILDDPALSVAMSNTSVGDVVNYLSQVSSHAVEVDWTEFGSSSEQSIVDQKISMQIEDQPFSLILDRLCVRLTKLCEEDIAWQQVNGVFEIHPEEHIDRLNQVMVSFQIEDIVDAIDATDMSSEDSAQEQLLSLMREYVEPHAWEANGGRTAQARIVGNKLFIKAPSRFLERIKWILDELEGMDQDSDLEEASNQRPESADLALAVPTISSEVRDVLPQECQTPAASGLPAEANQAALPQDSITPVSAADVLDAQQQEN